MHAQPTRKIEDIVIGERQRQDLGDIAGLAKSIDELGLLQPVVVTPDNKLVAGRRRLAAVAELKWTEVPVCVTDNVTTALALLKAEEAENTCRKAFTLSEAVAMADAIEVLEREEAEKRQHASRAKKGQKVGTGNLPTPSEGDKGRAGDKAAAAVGMSRRTYEKAKAVVEAAEQDPVGCGPIKEEMDRTGKVDPAYKKLQEHEARTGNGKPPSRRRRRSSTPKIKGLVKRFQRMVNNGYLPARRVEEWFRLKYANKMSADEQNELASQDCEVVRRQYLEWEMVQGVKQFAQDLQQSYRDPLRPPSHVVQLSAPWEPEKMSDETRQKAVAHLEGARTYLNQMIEKLK
jgi:ParB family chromosome partitioning protein